MTRAATDRNDFDSRGGVRAFLTRGGSRLSRPDARRAPHALERWTMAGGMCYTCRNHGLEVAGVAGGAPPAAGKRKEAQ